MHYVTWLATIVLSSIGTKWGCLVTSTWSISSMAGGTCLEKRIGQRLDLVVP